jgi:hypothetical protein
MLLLRAAKIDRKLIPTIEMLNTIPNRLKIESKNLKKVNKKRPFITLSYFEFDLRQF